MSKGSYQRPPRVAAELGMLSAFLDFHRDAMIRNVTGVSEEDARRPMVPSGISLLGLMKHLAYVERGWFQKTFAGEGEFMPDNEDDPDWDFHIEEGETIPGIIDFYERVCDKNRTIVASAACEDHAKREGMTEFTLRWIMNHMIEETARHNGHADIIRELIDGTVGE